MIARLFSVLVIGWCLGFALFAVSLPGPLEGATTDAVVVPTGGPGRIDRGLELIAARQAKRMLVTGVGSGVRPRPPTPNVPAAWRCAEATPRSSAPVPRR